MEESSKDFPLCNICGKYIYEVQECDHPKNGYCRVFKLISEIEKKERESKQLSK